MIRFITRSKTHECQLKSVKNFLCCQQNKVTLYTRILAYHDIQPLERMLRTKKEKIAMRIRHRERERENNFPRDPCFRSQIQPLGFSYLLFFCNPRIYFFLFCWTFPVKAQQKMKTRQKQNFCQKMNYNAAFPLPC